MAGVRKQQRKKCQQLELSKYKCSIWSEDVPDLSKVENSKTGKVYSGKTSGTKTAEQNVAARDANHHMNEKGFGEAQLDKSSTSADAIRGREQQLIQESGSAQSQGGTSGNAINGVSPTNPKADIYKNAAEQEFGKPK